MCENYMEIEGVEGDCDKEGRQGMMEIASFSQGISMPLEYGSNGQNRPRGAPMFMDFSVTRYCDRASPRLSLACARGERLPLVALRVFESAEEGGPAEEKITCALKDALITSISANGGYEWPMETICFSFAEVEWTYGNKNAPTEGASRMAKGGGSERGSAGWDTIARKGWARDKA